MAVQLMTWALLILVASISTAPLTPVQWTDGVINDSIDNSLVVTCSTPIDCGLDLPQPGIQLPSPPYAPECRGSSLTHLSPELTALEVARAEEIVRTYNLSWTAGMTSVSSVTPQSYQLMLGLISPRARVHNQPINRSGNFGASRTVLKVPASFDWRDNRGDWTTPVGDQGECGSCWAFSTTSAFESFWEIYNGDPGLNPDFSEQYLVSCDPEAYGCGGGDNRAMAYLTNKTGSNGGLGTVWESAFQYAASDLRCRQLGSAPRFKVPDGGGWSYLKDDITVPPPGDIKRAIMEYGPISAYLYASRLLVHYKEGIFEDPFVDPDSVWTNHAVLLVGWGHDPVKDMDYWIAKNSWGREWGEEGWFRIYVDQCLIGEGAAYFFANPLISDPVISSINPKTISAGSGEFTLTVKGKSIRPKSLVEWNGQWRITTGLSRGELFATIPAEDVVSDGTAIITIRGPDGRLSNAVPFTIGRGSGTAPKISRISPDKAQAGGDAFLLTVSGTRFVPGSQVKWRGIDRVTQFHSHSNLTASISMLDLLAPGPLQVTVVNPSGEISNAASFRVVGT
jgi:C1A family cysteine protease